MSRSSRAGHQVPTKGHEAKRPLPSSLFRLDSLAATKGGCGIEAEAIAKDDLDNVEAKAVAEDDSDNDEGASVGQPRCKTGATTGGRGAVVVTS